jgi:hypothetical protein
MQQGINSPIQESKSRKRRKNKIKSNQFVENETLSKEDIRMKLREKLRAKQTARLSRHSRENIIEKLENKMKGAKGKDKIKYKKQIKDLEDVDEKEIQNAYERTIPDYD